jgi:hypothetical protein
VYWVDYNDDEGAPTGTVRRVPIAGGAEESVATAQSQPIGITQDALAIYWADYGDGTIWRLAK